MMCDSKIVSLTSLILSSNDTLSLIPAGKRLCLGESLARSELFLFLTTLLQNFSLGSPKAPEDIDLTPRENGLGRPPPFFQVRFLPRRGGGGQEEEPWVPGGLSAGHLGST